MQLDTVRAAKLYIDVKRTCWKILSGRSFSLNYLFDRSAVGIHFFGDFFSSSVGGGGGIGRRLTHIQ